MKTNFEELTRTKKILLVILAMSILLVGIFTYIYRTTIFQRGNPFPYLISAMSLNDEVKFVELKEDTGIYITERGECPEFLGFIEKSNNVEFVEQMGNGYFFSNSSENITVQAEIYLRYFTVWTTLKTNTQG